MLERKTILLVQADLPARKLLSEELHQHGFIIVEAHSGPDALTVWKEHTDDIDLLLADSSIPGISGLELVDELRLSRPDLPVILMSDSSEQTAVSHIRGLPFIQKPFAPSAVIETVERTLRQNGEPLKTRSAG